jgi:hypothetical protein
MSARLHRPMLACAAALVLAAFRTADLPPQQLTIWGGGGGNAFSRTCAAGNVLTGIQFRRGATFDAVGILCRPVLSNGALGGETAPGTLAGGGGGSPSTISCPAGKVAIGGEIDYASFLGRVILQCRAWSASERTFGGASTTSYLDTGFDAQPFKQVASEFCDSRSQPVHGIRGRAASLVDALGFVCDEP